MLTIRQHLDQAHFYLNNGEIKKARQILELLLEKNHRNIDALQLLGIAHATDGNLNQAIAVFSRALKIDPVNSKLLFNRAYAYCENGQHLQALEDVEKSLLIDSQDYESLILYGFCCTTCGFYEKAINSYNTILKLIPNDFKALIEKGHLLINISRLAEASSIFQYILDNYPNSFETYFEYGNALLKLYNYKEACAFYEKAILINPNHPDAYAQLCIALRKLHMPHEALNCINRSISINPNSANYYNTRGNVLLDLCQFKQSKESFFEAIKIDPHHLESYSNLLFCLNYFEDSSQDQTLDIAKKYGDLVSSAVTKKFSTWAIDSNSRKLRIGFVSGDLRNHPVGFFMEGLVEELDSNQFDLFAFVTSPLNDELSDRLKPFFKDWISLNYKNDFESANLIHKQGIHILIDLSGHTTHHRLPVLAFKPAPIQISYLGYFATTGISEIDYFLGDPCMAPAGEEQNFTEKIWNLATTWLCLKPPSQLVEVKTAPVSVNGYIIFGCLGNLTKINENVIRVWSTIILRVPNSKLLLKSSQLADPKTIIQVRENFLKNGVSNDRLLLESHSPKTEYFETYNRIDIVLDTFPYPGGTTSIDALWMGCPVLTLKGNRFLSRLGESIATNAGQAEWIANNQSEYVDKAIAFAARFHQHPIDRLGQRVRVLETDLFNTKKFSQNFGNTMSVIWKMYKAKFFPEI